MMENNLRMSAFLIRKPNNNSQPFRYLHPAYVSVTLLRKAAFVAVDEAGCTISGASLTMWFMRLVQWNCLVENLYVKW